MKTFRIHLPRSRVALAATASMLATAAAAAGPTPGTFVWQTVVNNGDNVPGTQKQYNSYNQPSVNAGGLVVFRARSTGGSQGRESGIYTRQMPGGDINTIANLKTVVPDPNNTLGTFIEFPSIPRIAIGTDALATRGNHRSVWAPEGGDERVGTTGVYVNLDGNDPGSALLTGASKLGAVPGSSFFSVPGAAQGTFFDVFPGSPAIIDDGTIAFKGNYTEGGIAKTGVYYRVLISGGAYGESPVRLIANSDSEIPYLPPGVRKKFGSFDSTSPPSAAAGSAVFVGLDNEDDPTYGGIYEAQLNPMKEPDALSPLTLLVGLGTRVPGLTGPGFTRLGEGLSWDGCSLAFWGAWGMSTKTVRLYCPTEGNKLRQAFCRSEESGSTFDPAAGDWYQEKRIPINQGIFVHDAATGQNRLVARTNSNFDDFVFWNFSGRVEGMEEGDDGEPARWRSAVFIAVSGDSIAFKARTGTIDRVTHVYVAPMDGIYLQRGVNAPLEIVADTTMDGATLDPEAAGLPITELGLERDGFRGSELVINARMGVEEGAEGESWAGIYLTGVSAR
jgi:hypothetical protein